MKQFIWMLCGIFLSGLLLGTLSACGANQYGVMFITTGQPSQEEQAEAPAEPDPAPAEPDPTPAEEASPSAAPDEDTARRLAYGKVLWDALLTGELPDGENLDWLSAEDAAKNEFALCDLDGDGEEELLLRWTNACVAGMTDFVFRYDGEAVSLAFQEFAGTEFYAGAAAKAPWSHSQGWAGRFWPFNLYQYDAETKSYTEIGSVDAWDRSLFEDDEALSATFPSGIDADGDGLVYYILTGEWYKNSRVPSDGSLDGRLWGVDPVDGPDMENWLSFYTGGTEPLPLPLQTLTEDHIAALGAPKPDVIYPEPAG